MRKSFPWSRFCIHDAICARTVLDEVGSYDLKSLLLDARKEIVAEAIELLQDLYDLIGWFRIAAKVPLPTDYVDRGTILYTESPGLQFNVTKFGKLDFTRIWSSAVL